MNYYYYYTCQFYDVSILIYVINYYHRTMAYISGSQPFWCCDPLVTFAKLWRPQEQNKSGCLSLAAFLQLTIMQFWLLKYLIFYRHHVFSYKWYIIEWIVQFIDTTIWYTCWSIFKKEKFAKERKVHILRVYCAIYTVQLRGSHNRSY